MSVPRSEERRVGIESGSCGARNALIGAVELLLAALPSSAALVALSVAVLLIAPVALGSMCTVIEKLALLLGPLAASAPKVQTTVVVPAEQGEAEAKVVAVRRFSLPVPPELVEGPWLVTVIV